MEVQQKDETIQSQAMEIDQANKQIEIKNEEIRILLERMDQYKKHKDDQVEQLKGSLTKAQGDIKLLVNEHEK